MIAPQLRMLQIRAEMGGRKKPRRVRSIKVPRGTMRDYLRIILDLLEIQQEAIRRSVSEQLRFSIPTAPLRQDALSDVITALLASVRREIPDLDSPAGRRGLEAQISPIVSQTDSASAEQTRLVLRGALGFDVFAGAPDLQELSQLFVTENVSLVKRLQQQELSEVEELVLRGTRQGLRNQEIANQIQERFSVTKKRATLIATDQVNKLFGQLQQQRQTGLGIEEYIWRTSGDERVRSQHASRNGQKFRWSAPPPGGHPGQPVRCRCTAEPVIPGFTAEG